MSSPVWSGLVGSGQVKSRFPFGDGGHSPFASLVESCLVSSSLVLSGLVTSCPVVSSQVKVSLRGGEKMLKENIIFGILLGVGLALLVALGAEIIERMYGVHWRAVEYCTDKEGVQNFFDEHNRVIAINCSNKQNPLHGFDFS